MRGFLCFIVLVTCIPRAFAADPPRISDDTITALYSERIKDVPFSNCDMFVRNDDVSAEEKKITGAYNVTLHQDRTITYAPHFGLQYSTLRSAQFSGTHQPTIDLYNGRIRYDISPQDMISGSIDMETGGIVTFGRIPYVKVSPLVQAEFVEICGLRKNCRCVLEGVSDQAVVAGAIKEQLLKIEPLVAEYVKESFAKISEEVNATSRDQLFSAIVQTLQNNAELTNKVVDAVVSQLAQARDQRLATLITQRLSDDAKVREGIEQIVRSWIRRNPRP